MKLNEIADNAGARKRRGVRGGARRRVLADQMEYLLTHFPRTSPLHARLRDALAEASSAARVSRAYQ